MSVEAAAIRMEGVRKSFGANLVLDGVDLSIARGRTTVLIGPAASGKTVLLKCLLGLYEIDAGRIEIDGQNLATLGSVERAALFDRIGALFQYGGLFDSLPVWENIAFKLLNVRHMPPAEAREIAMEKLGLVGLRPAVADLYPADLSGGMQKRVGLARAIAGDPELLLLDNPTAGLDPIMTNQINRLIEDARSRLGASVLVITGDMDVARDQSDDLAMINDGGIIWSGHSDQIAEADNAYLQQMINGRAEGPITMRLRARA